MSNYFPEFPGHEAEADRIIRKSRQTLECFIDDEESSLGTLSRNETQDDNYFNTEEEESDTDSAPVIKSKKFTKDQRNRIINHMKVFGLTNKTIRDMFELDSFSDIRIIYRHNYKKYVSKARKISMFRNQINNWIK